MLTDLTNSVSYWLAMMQAWVYLLWSLACMLPGRVSSWFIFAITCIHYRCSLLINSRANWVTLFEYSDRACKDVTAVVRVDTSFGFNEKVQGRVTFQRYGTSILFRLLIDGHLPPVVGSMNADANTAATTESAEPQHGECKHITGAIYFPDSVSWQSTHKKVKGNSNTAIRGRSTLVCFKNNVAGINKVQVSFIHNTPKGKEISAEFQGAIDMATMATNRVLHRGSN
jgi:hypothetical protein